DSDTNQWKPVEYSGSYGTNGFYQKYSATELAASFTDSSTLHSIHTVTAGGNAHTDTTVKKFGTASLQLDGTGDYLSVSNNNDFNLGTGDFTIDCWVQSSDFVPGSDAGVIMHLQDSGSSDFRLAMGSAGRVVVGQDYGMSWTYNNGGSWSTTAYGSDLADGSWHHVACSRQGSYFYLFQDGVLVSTTSNWGNLNITGNATCQIGRRSTGQDYFEGYIDELRVSKGIARWTASFSVETSAYTADEYTALLLHMDGSDSGTTFTDSSWTSTSSYLSGRHTITANGDVTNERIKNNPVGFQTDGTGGTHIIGPKIGTGCLMVDGPSASNLSVASSSDWNMGTGDFTYEGWINLDKPTGNQVMFSHFTSGSDKWYVMPDLSYDSIALYDANSGLDVESERGVLKGQHEWQHVAVVRESGTIRFYVNGVQTGTHNSNTNPSGSFGKTAVMRIGDDGQGSDIWKGYMDELRISNTARYSSNFTPPTTAFSSDANTKLLMHCDGTHGSQTFTDSSSAGHTITANGTPMILVPKIGTGCYRNNRGNCGLYSPSTDNLKFCEFGTGDFTVECWVSLDDITTDNQQFFTHRNSVNNGDWVFWWDASNGLQWSGDSNTLSQGGTTGWANNTWVHIAASRASGVNKIFVNGTLVATNNSATQDYDATASLFIASYSTGTGGFTHTSGALQGFMDEARITPGKALYTSSFTPSTTAYTDNIDTRLLMHFDGGGPGTAGSDTNIGQGTYYHDSATNAPFYDSGVPKYKSVIAFDNATASSDNDYLSAPDS
ncbi:MAG: LamG domain-containing protein, partial [Anaerolineales bacterium]|nr:LamG domain-containing protein [Anaerolineales bacterium]